MGKNLEVHSKRLGQQGFSFMELAIVVAIMLTIAAMALPTLSTALSNYKLDVSGRVVSSLLQQARLQAVRNNVPAYTQFVTTRFPNLVYVNSDPSVAFAAGNPDVEVADVSFQSTNLPDHSQLDAYLNNGNTSTTTPEIATAVGFNARGLPCVEGTSAAVCQQKDTVTGNIPYFEWFLAGPRGGWEAVTVTPAGRVKAWRLSTSTGCGYPACWE